MAPTSTSTPEAKSVSKSDFIRAQPATLSAAQVVEKAKAQGIPLRPGLVYEVRRTDKAKKAAAPKPASPAAKKRAPKSSSSAVKAGGPKKAPTTSKAAFVRAHANLSPKEIVAKARAENIKLDVGYVYNVRSSSKGAKKKVLAQAARRGTEPKGAAPKPAAVSSRAETLLKAVAAEVGLGRAIELLQTERAKIGAAIGA